MYPPKVQFIALSFADGSVGIMQFVVQQYHQRSGAVMWEQLPTKAAVDAEVARSSFDHPVKAWRFIEPSEVPPDRTFRNAWRDSGKAIVHDMDKAREHVLKTVRKHRGPKLDALDRDWMRAFGKGDKAETARIEAQRQKLRDLPQSLDKPLKAASSVDELKALLPTD
jgi:hypothetical protein